MTLHDRSIAESTKSSEFGELAKTCETARLASSKLGKIKIVSDYFSLLELDEDLMIASTFLSGKIFPPSAEERDINVGYSLVWKAVSESHGLTDKQLSDFYLKHGDLGSAIEEYLRSLTSDRKGADSLLFESERLTLQSLYSAFRELARASGKGSTERRQRIIQRLFFSINSPLEAKYLIRIIGGEMRIGLVEGLVEESIAKAFSKTLTEVRSANLVMGDIGAVAVLARHNKLEEAKLELFRPTNFMLADSAESPQSLIEKFPQMRAYSEFKYDGIRAQIHSSDGKVRIFSRNLEDITRFFPEIDEAVAALNKQMILDGEIVPFRDGRPLSFQALQQRLRKLDQSNGDIPIRFFAFDLLYLDKPIIQEELSMRASTLHSLEFHSPLAFSEQRLVSTAEEIKEMFEESKSLGYEGLVAKRPGSAYTPGRRGKNWVKLKEELDTLDVVIVEAEYGHGKRAGVISDYTFAVRDEGGLKVVGKAYSGLTDVEILNMTELLKQITIRDYGYRISVRPQVVLEVAFDAVQRSARHDGGYALRFPRIKRIRSDKSVSQIDTIEKVKQIYETQKVKY